MVVVRGTTLFEKQRVSRNLFSSSPLKRSSGPASDDSELPDKKLNDLVAQRFFVKRTKRSYDLSVVSKRNSMLRTMANLKRASFNLNEMMQRRDKPEFFLGPKVPSSPEDRNNFAAPKHYVCEFCCKKSFSVSAYMKHLRKHKLCIRCSGCNRHFDHVLNKRRHELKCSKKTKLRL